ncbi:hypothetical protein N0V90_012666 [Kalmusia sp. IMI 367209]|nr:hypothetical protein N0V90_012666 [Kalmusia sp. IMI 367209]
MKFSAVIVAFTFAAAATAKTCGINGALCSRSVSSSGFTAKARDWLRTREVEAPKEARDVEAVEVEVQI